ncbi:T9SS type A sorting domain-containing protein [Aureitalea sp. L0-47]|uniref:T9SS type A sorting domain-containing protein n=1 Tax=Aureitalea sp. L0-47 TaxID=2816962 RepID=UPI002237ED87|nr:T9SS type A sorting domain-containing protein [Aureitalea sp. L0-47]MCW5519706.1 T9SS type A sorting domain-containing protein [Aureitalea sp. L0-47]
MKKIFMLMAVLGLSLNINAQITGNFTNDFEDGTTQGWSNGAQSPNPPTNIPTGGPNGVDDNFLEEISAGGGGAGSKMVIQNDEDEWTGNYNSAGVLEISFDVKNAGATDLLLRVAMEGGPDSSEMATTSSVSVPSTQTTWTTITIPIQPSDFTVLDGNDTASAVLGGVDNIRILSSAVPSYNGDAIAATMHVDNITAVAPLSVSESNLNDVTLYPNPVSDVLNVASSNSIEKFEIINIAGQLITEGELNAKFIQVSNLSEGLYFLRLSNNLGARTIKFVKR